MFVDRRFYFYFYRQKYQESPSPPPVKTHTFTTYLLGSGVDRSLLAMPACWQLQISAGGKKEKEGVRLLVTAQTRICEAQVITAWRS